MTNQERYESPEIFELGDAEKLTLGGDCTCSDGCCGETEDDGGGTITISG